MDTVEKPGKRRRGAVAAVGASAVALLLAGVSACGTITLGGPAAPAPSPAPVASNADIQLVDGTASSNGEAADSGVDDRVGATAPADWQQISAAPLRLGTGVVGVDGRTLYRFDQDSATPPRTTCDGPCAATWPPVVLKPGSKLYLGPGVDRGKIGTVTRPDGGQQVTVGGWPVYRFAGDHAAGDTNGQGVRGTWFAVGPDGRKLGAGPGRPASPSSPPAPPPPSPVSSGPAPPAPRDGTAKRPSLTWARTPVGSVVADGSGRTVYVSDRDDPSTGTVGCGDRCLAGHDPVPAADRPSTDVPGVRPGAVGSVRRPDGRTQMTYEGYPLYTARSDGRRGDVTGQDAHWFALGLDGDKQP